MANRMNICPKCLRSECNCKKPEVGKAPAAAPTFSMQPVRYEDHSCGVSIQVTGLTSEQQAEAAMQHMQKLFCGAEIEQH